LYFGHYETACPPHNNHIIITSITKIDDCQEFLVNSVKRRSERFPGLIPSHSSVGAACEEEREEQPVGLICRSGVIVMPTHASEADRHYPLSGATPAPIETFVPQEETNMVIVGILVGLIVVLSAILVILLARPVMDFVRSRLPENQRRKELRYKTVEGWLISKVSWLLPSF
jgi:hypothetical protein